MLTGREQHQHRSGPALRRWRGMEGEDVRAVPQQPIDQVLEHRRAAAGHGFAGVPTLAVDHPHAGMAVLARIDDETPQQGFGGARIGAVQVQLVLHRNFAPLQALQYPRGHRVAPVGEGIGGFQQRLP